MTGLGEWSHVCRVETTASAALPTALGGPRGTLRPALRSVWVRQPLLPSLSWNVPREEGLAAASPSCSLAVEDGLCSFSVSPTSV